MLTIHWYYKWKLYLKFINFIFKKNSNIFTNKHFTIHFHALEKEMATHSSVLAWRIPGTGEPGGLPSMGSHRVGHNWSGLAAAAAANLYFTTKIRNVKIYSIIYINNKIHYWSLTSRSFEKLWDRLPTRLFQSGLAGLCYILKDKNKTKTEMLSQTKCLK